MMRNDHLVSGYMIGSMAVNFILALVLLFSSIGLLSLRRWSRAVLLLYAMANVVVIIIGQFAGILIIAPRTQRATEAAMQSYPMFNTQMVKMVIQFGQIFGVCFGLVLLVWPAAILYLMTRDDVKAAFAKPANKI